MKTFMILEQYDQRVCESTAGALKRIEEYLVGQPTLERVPRAELYQIYQPSSEGVSMPTAFYVLQVGE